MFYEQTELLLEDELVLLEEVETELLEFIEKLEELLVLLQDANKTKGKASNHHLFINCPPYYFELKYLILQIMY